MAAAATMLPPGPCDELEPMTPDELKAWRAAHGLSQPQLARRLEIAVGTLRNYEQGIRRIPSFMRRALRDLAAELAAEREGE